MYIYILGGFLGSGKTSLLMEIASKYVEKGHSVALLVNESGNTGVDGATLKRKGYNSTVLPNGCICCDLAGDLEDGVRNIIKDIDPDIIIIEPTGLAVATRVKDIVRLAVTDQEEIQIIGIVDLQRFEDFIKKREDFFIKQMQGCEFILLNKCDLVTLEKVKKASDWMISKFPGVKLLPVSIKTGDNLDKIYELMI